MVAFAESTTCRMAALIQHFGDTTDTRATCGLCDICNPSGNSASAAHQPTADERGWLRTILRALEGRGTSTGKLFTDLKLTKDRSDFDTLLDALARAGLITLANDTFTTPEGKDITYKKAAITHEGREPDEATLDTVWIRGSLADAASPKARKKSGAPSVKASASRAGSQETNPAAEELFNQLRAWRTETARPTKTPAFMILADAVLRAIAHHNPQDLKALHAVPGMSPAKVERYGAAILAVTRGEAPPQIPKPEPETQPLARGNRHLETESEPRGLRAPSATSAFVSSTTSAVRQNKPTPPPAPAAELTPTQLALDARLKDWRRETARTAGLPSFFIVSDTVLGQIVRTPPATLADLRNLRGLDPAKLEAYGEMLVKLCHA
jgi:ATP-dependent DNA helicase RecQ